MKGRDKRRQAKAKRARKLFQPPSRKEVEKIVDELIASVKGGKECQSQSRAPESR